MMTIKRHHRFTFSSKRQSEGEWQGGEVYLCDGIVARNPGLARLSILALDEGDRLIASSKDKNKVVSPVDEEEEEEEERRRHAAR